MGFRETADVRLGRRVRDERQRRGWTQEDLAKQLVDSGVSVYASTIAKIESEGRPRQARLDELCAMADLFGTSVDSLLGRQEPDDTTLEFAMANSWSYAGTAQQQLRAPLQTASDIEAINDEAAQRFDAPELKDLVGLSQEATNHLVAASNIYEQIESISRKMITESKDID